MVPTQIFKSEACHFIDETICNALQSIFALRVLVALDIQRYANLG